MAFKLFYHESGSVELTSPTPQEVGHHLMKAGCDPGCTFLAGNKAIDAKGPSVGPIDAGNGVTISRRLENRRRVYTIAWSRFVDQNES